MTSTPSTRRQPDGVAVWVLHHSIQSSRPRRAPDCLIYAQVLIVLDILFPIVFGRLLLVAMLEERNVRLARSITEAADRSRGNVVAILGALHVNGVARLLKDPSGYGEGKAGTWWTDDMIEAKPE